MQVPYRLLESLHPVDVPISLPKLLEVYESIFLRCKVNVVNAEFLLVSQQELV